MNDLVKNKENSLIGLLHSKNNGVSEKMPYERDIFLFDTFIAGTSYVDNIDEIEQLLQENSRLNFYRETANKYDDNAIVIKTESGQKVGYIPKNDNIVFSRLMDAGKLLFGKVSEKKKKGKWLKIYIRVYLHEWKNTCFVVKHSSVLYNDTELFLCYKEIM